MAHENLTTGNTTTQQAEKLLFTLWSTKMMNKQQLTKWTLEIVNQEYEGKLHEFIDDANILYGGLTYAQLNKRGL